MLLDQFFLLSDIITECHRGVYRKEVLLANTSNFSYKLQTLNGGHFAGVIVVVPSDHIYRLRI